jgi:hypothetical protein
MSARRSFLNALLVLCLLWSQQAALAHAISHIPAPAGQQSHPANLAPTVQGAGDEVSDFCLECLAFAQVTTAAPGSAATVAVAIPVVTFAASPPYSHYCTALFPFHARGPPASL